MAAGSGDVVAGKKAFGMQCRACHQVATGAGSGMGPNLAALAGRGAATDPDFDYSPALRTAGQAGLKWDAATLDGFIARPKAVVPGTVMPMSVPDATVRADIVAYLLTLVP